MADRAPVRGFTLVLDGAPEEVQRILDAAGREYQRILEDHAREEFGLYGLLGRPLGARSTLRGRIDLRYDSHDVLLDRGRPE